MDYEIVELKEKLVAGIEARTSNDSPEMTYTIGKLWGRFYQEGIYEGIQDKKNDKSLGIYSDYAGERNADYNVTVACEVNKASALPEGTVLKKIPAGKYAKFVVKGKLHSAVADFWVALWQMDLNRAYTSDFEEYQNSDEENAEIHMYIALKN